MPLHLSSSNRIETLQQQLADLFSTQPLADVFARELVRFADVDQRQLAGFETAGERLCVDGGKGCHGGGAHYLFLRRGVGFSGQKIAASVSMTFTAAGSSIL